MKKVIEAKGKFFVKEYNKNGDSVAISEPFDTELAALATIAEESDEVEAPKKKAAKKVAKKASVTDEE